MRRVHDNRVIHWWYRWLIRLSCKIERRAQALLISRPVKATVGCSSCGWQGVGIQTQVGRDGKAPWCPRCHSAKNIKPL